MRSGTKRGSLEIPFRHLKTSGHCRHSSRFSVRIAATPITSKARAHPPRRAGRKRKMKVGKIFFSIIAPKECIGSARDSGLGVLQRMRFTLQTYGNPSRTRFSTSSGSRRHQPLFLRESMPWNRLERHPRPLAICLRIDDPRGCHESDGQDVHGALDRVSGACVCDSCIADSSSLRRRRRIGHTGCDRKRRRAGSQPRADTTRSWSFYSPATRT